MDSHDGQREPDSALILAGIRSLHDRLSEHGVPILTAPFDTPFGLTFVFADPDGYEVAIHGATPDE